MNWCNDYAYWWIDEWKLLLLLNIYESLVNYWILTKWCLNLEFWASLSVCSCIWPINIIWDVFWVWKDQNWSVWGKGFWNSKFFSEHMSVRLNELQANLKRACPGRFWTQFALASYERSCKRTRMLILDKVRLSEP